MAWGHSGFTNSTWPQTISSLQNITFPKVTEPPFSRQSETFRWGKWLRRGIYVGMELAHLYVPLVFIRISVSPGKRNGVWSGFPGTNHCESGSSHWKPYPHTETLFKSTLVGARHRGNINTSTLSKENIVSNVTDETSLSCRGMESGDPRQAGWLQIGNSELPNNPGLPSSMQSQNPAGETVDRKSVV